MTERPILVVDDDADLRAFVVEALREKGYRTVEAEDGEAALARVHEFAPALVILDVGLDPQGMDGFEVCRRIRNASQVPILFLTGQTEEIDHLMGMALGGDEYLTKPVSPRMLLAHVQALLRRTNGTRQEEPIVLESSGLRVDLESRTVHVAGEAVDLTRIQFELLSALAENPSRVLTREQLVDRVWGDWYGTDHHLDVHLSRLRAKIEGAGGPRVAWAVRGVGFRLQE